MKNRKRDRLNMALLVMVGVSILGIIGLKLLHISLPPLVYQMIAAAYLLIALFCIYRLLKQGKGKLIHPVPQESRINVLKKYAEYDLNHKEEGYVYTFQMGNEPPAILEKYDYTEYLEGVEPASDKLAFRLLDFVCDHFHHDGNAVIGNAHRMVDIIAVCEKNDGKTNCRGLSLILASLLRMNGIKARHITCMPYEEPFNDCHVVVDCLLPSGKRVMLDPTMRLYLKDADGEYVSLEQFREGMIQGADFFGNQDASYNGGGFDKEFYLQYMSKNLFRFSQTLHHEDVKNESKLGRIELVPKGYPVKDFPDKSRFVYHPAVFWSM